MKMAGRRPPSNNADVLRGRTNGPLSVDHRKNISASLRGKNRTPEARHNILKGRCKMLAERKIPSMSGPVPPTI